MHIANPIYDVVFKYLMEDQEIAKLIISTIIGEDVVELDFLPQERTIAIEQRSLTVFRLDFSAKIKKPDGSLKLILIEIQKAKLATDIMRFRRYLAEQYQNQNNTYLVQQKQKEIKAGIPLVSIYFLGYQLEYVTAPVIKVARHYYDLTTGEEIKEREVFIESLTHDSFIIQIPYLKKPTYKSEIERLLSIFDQDYTTSDKHILNINEAEYPEKYRRIIRRLQRAIAEPEVKQTMDAEDEILEELAQLEREIQHKNEVIIEQSKALEDKDKALEDKDKALEDKDKALEEQSKALEDKDKLIAELQKKLQSSE